MSIKPCWGHYKVPFSISPNELWWCLQVNLFWDWIKYILLQSLKKMLSISSHLRRSSFNKAGILMVSSGRLSPSLKWVKTANLKWCLCCQNRDKKPLLLMCACCNSCWRPINKTLPPFNASFWHLHFACFLLIVKMWTVEKKKLVMNCLKNNKTF